MTTADKVAPPPDPVLEELHRTRRRMLDDCGGSLDELVARLRDRERVSGHPLSAVPVTATGQPVNETAAPGES